MPIVTENIRDISLVIADVDRATVLVAESLKNSIQFELASNNLKIIIDLSSCEFIDSTFLSALVTSYKRIAENGGVLKIVGLKPAVNSMFQLTRLSTIFDIYKTVEGALKSFD